jgi:hypothetical protein
MQARNAFHHMRILPRRSTPRAGEQRTRMPLPRCAMYLAVALSSSSCLSDLEERAETGVEARHATRRAFTCEMR